MRRLMGWLVAPAVVLLFACGDDGAGDDASVRSDAAAASDAGADAAPSDGGVADTGVRDSGTSDAGAVGMCPSGECELLTGAGCAEGEACYFATVDGGPLEPRCGTSGSGTDGDPCENLSDCASGHRCDPEDGVCRHYCCADSDADCPQDQICAVTLTDVDGSPTSVGFCKSPDSCDLLTQEGCPEGQGCYPRGGEGVICISPDEGMLTENEECTFTNDCAPGFACFELTLMGEDSSRCVDFCDTEAEASECQEGQSCTSLDFPEPMEHVGFCNPPMG